MSLIPTVRYVDLGILSAKQFWTEVAFPAYERFQTSQKGSTTIEAALANWHVHEWVWHEKHPGSSTRRNQIYIDFKNDLFVKCKKLILLQDIADAGKHRGLGRPSVVVSRVSSESMRLVDDFGDCLVDDFGFALASEGPNLELMLTDGSKHLVTDVLSKVVAYWKIHFKIS